MTRLLETIKVERRRLYNLAAHSARMNRARRELFACSDIIELEQAIRLPADLGEGVYRCRLLYSRQIEELQFIPYTIREVGSLRLIHDDRIDYSYKYEDRSALDKLFALRGESDDVLIVRRGYLSDCSYSNIIFWDGSRWLTPDSPLLKGTKRELLLKEGAIKEAALTPAALNSFEKASLINAMLDIGQVVIPIEKIVR